MIEFGIIMNSTFLLPGFILFVFIYAMFKKIDSYSAFIKGSKEGISLFTSVFPAMLSMMLAITLLRESGLMNVISSFISIVIPSIPSSIWPMAFFRPISGSASLAILVDIFKTEGVDSLAGIMASIIQGSTDTTFYVITLYFSSVGVKKIKNSLTIGLLADLTGITIAILLTLAFFSA